MHRLKIMQGQLRGLEKMVTDDAYCLDILNQSRAVQESLKSFNAFVLENHLKEHAANELKGKNKDKAIKELLKLYAARIH